MARANASDLLVNGASDAEIRKSLTPDVSSALAVAYEGWLTETEPLGAAPDAVVDRFIDEDIGGFIALTLASATAEARREFSDQVLIELAEVPVDLARDAFADARRKVSFANRLVPHIFEFVGARLDKLRLEGERLRRLMEIAGGR